MNPRSCCVYRRGVELGLAALAVAFATAAGAQTAIKGVVTDRVTGSPLAGATIEVRRGAETLGRAVTDARDGSFLLTVEVGSRPEATNLKLIVSRDGYKPEDEDVVVVSGQPRPARPAVSLLRNEVADCLSRMRAPWIVVGHFRPPTGSAGGGEFSARVTDAVRWEISKIAETSSLAANRRPAVVPCAGIDERDFLSATARELQADALLSGGVSRPPNRERFTVSIFLGDPHGLFTGTAPITSRDVDLDDPSASRLDSAASAAILQAVLTGYLKAGRFEDCVELSRRAGAELRPLPRAIADLNAQCTLRLPAQGLRGGTR